MKMKYFIQSIIEASPALATKKKNRNNIEREREMHCRMRACAVGDGGQGLLALDMCGYSDGRTDGQAEVGDLWRGGSGGLRFGYAPN